jgi:hypothetical protein
MTEFIIAASKTTTAVRASAKDMLDAGELTAYSVRADGTTRHLELCPVGSTRRDTAEWISERLEDGATVAQVAGELHVSKPTVRRFIMALELTEEIEAGEWDQVWADANDLPYLENADTADTLETMLGAWATEINAADNDPLVLMTVHL